MSHTCTWQIGMSIAGDPIPWIKYFSFDGEACYKLVFRHFEKIPTFCWAISMCFWIFKFYFYLVRELVKHEYQNISNFPTFLKLEINKVSFISYRIGRRISVGISSHWNPEWFNNVNDESATDSVGIANELHHVTLHFPIYKFPSSEYSGSENTPLMNLINFWYFFLIIYSIEKLLHVLYQR